MSNIAIKVENVSKLYRLGEVGTGSMAHDVNRWWHRVRGKEDPYSLVGETNDRTTKGSSDYAWALRDVSFEVKQGEVLGIIGRNGAGKSTLLKILSRVTAPTKGEVKIKGRIASLLEVGTGFHPELTGRENVYLNGAILGMRKAEIARKFDEIVDFSGCERYIDTPAKRYSSGMQVRLGFAVAAHLEPEILIIDEVLAVGDAEFQKRCLGKMQDVSSHGRTVLFVSHNMGMINSLCPTSMLLEHGGIAKVGPSSKVTLEYYGQGNFAPHEIDYSLVAKPPGDTFATLIHASIQATDGLAVYEVDIRSSFKVVMQYRLLQSVPVPPYPNFHFFDARGECVFVTSSTNYMKSSVDPGLYEAECTIPANLLNDGVYFVGLALTFTHRGVHVSFYERDALSFNVRDPIDETLQVSRSGYSGPLPGVIRPRLDWKIQQVA